MLDAGCGAGWGTALLAESAAGAVGIDLAPAAISAAQELSGDLADFREGDLRSLPFGDREFDVVVCFEAIVHIADTEKALDEARRVLRPDGLLLISSPNRGVYPTGNPLHLRELTSSELEEKLSARFKRVAIHRQQTYFASLLAATGTLADNDPSNSMDVEVGKLTNDPAGSELYAVAVATDGELPTEPAHVALGEQVHYEEQRRELAAWQKRAVEAEAELLAARREARLLRGKE